MTRKMKSAMHSLLLAMLVGIGAHANAQNGQSVAPGQILSTLRPTELRMDKLTSAAVLQNLTPGAKLRLVSLEGGWALVEVSSPSGKGSLKVSGWVRASAVDWRPVSSVASNMVSGREAAGNTALTLGVRSLPPRFNRHALIIGVSKYEDPNIPSLPGVKFDRESATQIARSMQVPDSNMTYLYDEHATGNEIRRAVKELSQRAQEGDRVFVYFSGHGTRYLDKTVGGCVEGLLGYNKGWDGMITNREMATMLGDLTNKTDKLFVMYDSCHSGGVAQAGATHKTRSLLGDDNPPLQPKFVSTSEECSRPINAKTRNLIVEATSNGAMPDDIVFLGAAHDNEISFDDPDKGGLATQYIRDCMLRDAVDSKHTGAITIEQIRQCAQEKLDKRMSLYSMYSASNIVLNGNMDFVPAWFSKPSQTPVKIPKPIEEVSSVQSPAASTPNNNAGSIAQAPQKIPETHGETQKIAVPVPIPEKLVTGEQALKQLYSQRQAKRKLDVTVKKSILKIGVDSLDFDVLSDRAGYVYVALAGSDNESLYVLFPNELDSQNKIEKGQPLHLPRSSWRVKAGGPEGSDSLLVMVTDAPRDLVKLDSSKAGPFIKSLNDEQGRSQMGALLTASKAGASSACSTKAGQANRAMCSDAYSAVLVKVEETK